MIVPQAVFEQHIIVLGKTRSGKSSAMRVLVESLLDHNKPVTIVDPKGDWWGLKSSSSGRQAGYPVVIFGGEHADVPLNASSGRTVAELLATGNRSAIVDLGGWMPGDRTQFWIDFASTYFRTHRGRHYLVIDEVHNFCPKGKIMDPNAGKMLHWSNRLASEGLGKGISILGASQRPQKVHNDFLTSCETLIAMRVIHKADRDALGDWIDGCGDPEKGEELLNTIAMNKRGEAWVWSPEAEFGPKRIQFPMFKTYDSFKAQGAKQSKLKGWAEVNLNEVRKKLEVAVKEAEANDPAKLKQRIRILEEELKKPGKTLSVQMPAKELVHRMSGDVVREARAPFEKAIREYQRQIKITIQNAAKGMDSVVNFCMELQRGMKALAEKRLPILPKFAYAEIKIHQSNSQTTSRPQARVGGALPSPKVERPAAPIPLGHYQVPAVVGRRVTIPHDGEALPKGERSMMIAMSQYPDGVARDTLTVLTGYKRSTRDAYVQRLKERGFVSFNGRGEVKPTDEGIGALGADYEQLPTGDALREHWLRKLPEGERKVLEFILQHGQEAIERDPITDATGYKRSTRDAYLQRLVSRRLVEISGRNQVKASDTLFD